MTGEEFFRAFAQGFGAGDAAGLAALIEGVEMTERAMLAALERHGVKKIEPAGQKFDPNFHQAVMRVEDPEREDDTVAQALQKGYMVKGRVIRPSMVQVVSN